MKIINTLKNVMFYIRMILDNISVIDFTQKMLSILPIKAETCDSIMRKYMGGTYIRHIEVHAADTCNLNCIYCDHFSPIADESIIPIENILNDLEMARSIFDRTRKIFITGGEPLLNPNITDLFPKIRELYPKSKIVILTNGILLSKQTDSFWESLKKYNITLGMTAYPIKVDYDFYYKKCKRLHIKPFLVNFNKSKMHSVDLNYKCTNNKEKSFKLCRNKTCHILRNGRLYHCSLIPYSQFLNKRFNLNFAIQDGDYVDLTKVKSATEINRFFRKPVHFCGYCRDKARGYSSWRNSSKQVTEWVREDTL